MPASRGVVPAPTGARRGVGGGGQASSMRRTVTLSCASGVPTLPTSDDTAGSRPWIR
jgi:hypothetical protein